MFNSNIWPNSAPLHDLSLRNLSDLSRSLVVKWDDVIGVAIYGFLLTYSNYISNPHHLALIATQNIFSSYH